MQNLLVVHEEHHDLLPVRSSRRPEHLPVAATAAQTTLVRAVVDECERASCGVLSSRKPAAS